MERCKTKRIFLTVGVGTLRPFDRLTKAVDQFLNRNSQYICTGQTGKSDFSPQRINQSEVLSIEQFSHAMASADIIISHAGMGNILLASELNKPIIVLARRAHMKEINNDHQVGTMEGFKNSPFIYCMQSETELAAAIRWAENWSQAPVFTPERLKLINTLKSHIGSL